MPPKKPLSKKPVETEEEEIMTTSSPAPSPSLKLYRRIAMVFLCLVGIVLVAVLYVSTTQAVIHVRPVEEVVKANFLLDVVKIPTQPNEIRGKIVTATLTKTQTFTPTSGGTKQVEGIAKGSVVLHNTSNTPQSLVKTTRLLSADGVLFRIDSDVTVPAQGTVEAKVYADKPGATGDAKPGKFTIPGLNAARQEQVYAESTTAFAGGMGSVAVVSQADIDKSVATLKKTLETDLVAELRKKSDGSFTGESFGSSVTDQKSSVVPGTEAASFDITATVEGYAVFFDKVAVQDLASKRLYEALGPGRQFAHINEAGFQATVEKADVKNEKANVRVLLDGGAIPTATSVALDPSRFVGMSPDDVRQALVSEGVALEVTVELSPFWVKKVPRLRDHVKVQIE